MKLGGSYDHIEFWPETKEEHEQITDFFAPWDKRQSGSALVFRGDPEDPSALPKNVKAVLEEAGVGDCPIIISIRDLGRTVLKGLSLRCNDCGKQRTYKRIPPGEWEHGSVVQRWCPRCGKNTEHTAQTRWGGEDAV